MPAANAATDISETLSAPLGDMIAAVGRGIAEAQKAMDDETFRRFKALFRADDEVQNEMRRLGFTPTWYRIPEAEADITVSLSISGPVTMGPETAPATTAQDATVGGPGRIKLYASPVDANYVNKYDFKAEAVSRVKFRVVAVPPSPQAETTKVVPSGLLQMKFGDAKKLLDEWEIPFQLTGTRSSHPESLIVNNVTPKPGSTLPPGEPITLSLS